MQHVEFLQILQESQLHIVQPVLDTLFTQLHRFDAQEQVLLLKTGLRNPVLAIKRQVLVQCLQSRVLLQNSEFIAFLLHLLDTPVFYQFEAHSCSLANLVAEWIASVVSEGLINVVLGCLSEYRNAVPFLTVLRACSACTFVGADATLLLALFSHQKYAALYTSHSVRTLLCEYSLLIAMKMKGEVEIANLLRLLHCCHTCSPLAFDRHSVELGSWIQTYFSSESLGSALSRWISSGLDATPDKLCSKGFSLVFQAWNAVETCKASNGSRDSNSIPDSDPTFDATILERTLVKLDSPYLSGDARMRALALFGDVTSINGLRFSDSLLESVVLHSRDTLLAGLPNFYAIDVYCTAARYSLSLLNVHSRQRLLNSLGVDEIASLQGIQAYSVVSLLYAASLSCSEKEPFVLPKDHLIELTTMRMQRGSLSAELQPEFVAVTLGFEKARLGCILKGIALCGANSALTIFEHCLDECFDATTNTFECYIRIFTACIERHPAAFSHSKLSRASSVVLQLLKDCWTQSQCWASTLDAAASFLFCPLLMQTPEADEAWGTLVGLSQSRLNVLSSAASFASKHILDQLRSGDIDVSRYSRYIVDMIWYCPDRELDSINQRHASYVELLAQQQEYSLEDWEYVKLYLCLCRTAEANFYITDYKVRIRGFQLLLDLNPQVEVDSALARSVVRRLFDFLDSTTTQIRFPNTNEQRRNLLIWQALHVLFQFFEFENMKELFERATRAISLDVLQNNRLFIVWLLVRAVLKYPDSQSFLWMHLRNSQYVSHVTITLLYASSIIASHLESDAMRNGYFTNLFNVLLPWSLSHHINIRMIAQFTLYSAREYCISNGIDVPDHIASAVAFIICAPKFAEHKAKTEGELLVSFDPISDLNIEFLFCTAVALSGYSLEMRISHKAFNCDGGWINLELGKDKVSTYVARLNAFEVTPESSKGKDALSEDSSKNKKASGKEQNDNEMKGLDASTAIQKKIVPLEPWMQKELDQETSKLMDATRSPLILVASLIDKAPNLGGLCRTCEIFNLEKLVVPNLEVRNDIAFRGTSVTADKWMPMEEVRERNLIAWLARKKSEGYAIIGLEQATNSVRLGEFSFPKKSVIVLGNERQGMSRELLAVLDHIVEIPQFGIVRSLNVHVSGALIVWEYIKQHRVTQE